MTLEDVMSFLETLEELFGENYKEAKQIKTAMVMLQGKAKVWWGQLKADHEALDQPPTNTWVEFKQIFTTSYMWKDYSTHKKEELIQLKQN